MSKYEIIDRDDNLISRGNITVFSIDDKEPAKAIDVLTAWAKKNKVRHPWVTVIKEN